MRIVDTIAEMRAARHDGVLGLVPTMGALHGGHAALFAAARVECETVVASVMLSECSITAASATGPSSQGTEKTM